MTDSDVDPAIAVVPNVVQSAEVVGAATELNSITYPVILTADPPIAVYAGVFHVIVTEVSVDVVGLYVNTSMTDGNPSIVAPSTLVSDQSPSPSEFSARTLT